MVTAKLAQKPYLEIPESLYDELVSKGEKAIKISILQDKRKTRIFDQAADDKLQTFVDKTLGIWVDAPEIDKAFDELEERWQQWREKTLS